MSLTEIVETKPLSPKEQLQNLIEYSKLNYGFPKERTMTILKAAGFTKFSPDEWHTYLGILKAEYDTQQLTVKKKQVCPICGAEIVDDPKMNNMYHQSRGWRCTKDSNHFTQFAWERLKPFMTGQLLSKEEPCIS